MSNLLRKLLKRFEYRTDFVATAAAVIGIAGGLNSLFGGNSAPGSGNYIYSNPFQQENASIDWVNAENQARSGTGQLTGSVQQPILQALQRALGTSSSGLDALPQQLRQAYGGIANTDQLYASLLGQTGAGALRDLPAAGISTYLNSLDPQNALHDKLRQSVADTSGAGQAQRGIEIGGVGQGMSDQANTNFELDWSNQLLGRQVQGLTALEQAFGNAGQTGTNTLNASSNMASQVPGALTGAASAPQTASGINSNFLSTILQQLGGGFQQFGVNPQLQLQNQIIPFLNGGQGAGANAFKGDLTSLGINQGNQAAGTQSLLTGLGGLETSSLGKWLNTMGGSSGGGGGNTSFGGTWGGS